MPTTTEPRLLTFKDWVFRLRPPEAEPSRLILLIHGWIGDENSMGVLARRLSQNYVILAPRGPYPVSEGGFSWREIRPGSWGMATIEDLHPSVSALLAFVDEWSISAGMDAGQFDVMGFSQGAALGYTLALLHPDRVRRLAALSGFIPEGGETLIIPQQQAGKPIFISHGRQDDLIPVEQARRAVASLKKAGAQVTYCESDSAHKINKECLKAMEYFFGFS